MEVGHHIVSLSLGNAANPGAGWFFIQWMTNKTHEPVIGKFHGGAPRLSTWDDADYADSFEPGYVKAVFEAMPNSKSSVVLRAGWSEFALRIVDTIQAIYGGETPEAAVAAAQEFRRHKSPGWQGAADHGRPHRCSE